MGYLVRGWDNFRIKFSVMNVVLGSAKYVDTGTSYNKDWLILTCEFSDLLIVNQ